MGDQKQQSRPALLNVIYVPQPYDREAEMKKAVEAGASEMELKALSLRGGRIAYDWGYNAYNAKDWRDVQPLKSGDLVKIFKTVTNGRKAWEGVIELEYSRRSRGLQKGVDAHKWANMFYRELPAKMQRGDKVIFGALEPFCETGTEGVVWSVHEYGKPGYEGLNCLEDGDRLTVYSSVRNGAVEWEGPVDFGPESVTRVSRSDVLRQANHMKTEDWLQMSWQRRPVIVTPR